MLCYKLNSTVDTKWVELSRYTSIKCQNPDFSIIHDVVKQGYKVFITTYHHNFCVTISLHGLCYSTRNINIYHRLHNVYLISSTISAVKWFSLILMIGEFKSSLFPHLFQILNPKWKFIICCNPLTLSYLLCICYLFYEPCEGKYIFQCSYFSFVLFKATDEVVSIYYNNCFFVY